MVFAYITGGEGVFRSPVHLTFVMRLLTLSIFPEHIGLFFPSKFLVDDDPEILDMFDRFYLPLSNFE